MLKLAEELARSLLCLLSENTLDANNILHTERKPMLTAIATFIRDEEGATAVEYGLMAALIAAVIIAAVTTIGTSLNTVFNGISAKLTVAS